RLKEQYKYRVHEARWSQTTVGGAFRAQIRIQGEDRAGMATTITEMVSRTLNINIRTLNIDSKDGQVTGTLAIEVASSTMVDMVVAHLKKIAGVNKVSRVN
ncbi:MAG: ACT domain-containing protein, partial [Mucinivorans sp.]